MNKSMFMKNIRSRASRLSTDLETDLKDINTRLQDPALAEKILQIKADYDRLVQYLNDCLQAN